MRKRTVRPRWAVKPSVHVTNGRSILLFLLGDIQDKIVSEDEIDHDFSIVIVGVRQLWSKRTHWNGGRMHSNL